MKRLISLLVVVLCLLSVRASSDSARVALLLVDIQDFYFPGGVSELVAPAEAGEKAQKVLVYFREKGWPVVHVKHRFSPGGDINERVLPQGEEKVVEKTEVNAFNGTHLLAHLKELKVDSLVIAGMQTHMCVEAAVRAAYDLGFTVILVEDACATKDLNYEGNIIKSKDVHESTLLTLKSYATIIKAEEIEKCFRF